MKKSLQRFCIRLLLHFKSALKAPITLISAFVESKNPTSVNKIGYKILFTTNSISSRKDGSTKFAIQ